MEQLRKKDLKLYYPVQTTLNEIQLLICTKTNAFDWLTIVIGSCGDI
jgi:hypothetical protein